MQDTDNFHQPGASAQGGPVSQEPPINVQYTDVNNQQDRGPQTQYADAQYAQGPYGQPQYAQGPYGQPQYTPGANPYSQQPYGPHYRYAPHPPADKLVHTDSMDSVALGLTIVLLFVFFFDWFGVAGNNDVIGWVWACLYTVAMVFTGAYIATKRKKFELSALPAGIAGVAMSAIFTLRSTDTIRFALLPFLIYLTGTYMVTLSGANRHKKGSWTYMLDVLHCYVFAPFAEYLTPYRSMRRTRKLEGPKPPRKKMSRNTFFVLLGIGCGLVALCAIIPLLSKSNEGFAQAMRSIFGVFADFFREFFDDFFTKFFLLILVTIATCVTFPLVYSSLFASANGITAEKNRDTTASWAKARRLPLPFVISFLGVVAVVYLVYVVTQVTYLFSAFYGKVPDGETLSGYARSGFFELVAIACINLVIIAATVLFTRRNGDKISLAVRLIDAFICLFTMFVTVISMSKIVLYMSTLGLTHKRLGAFSADVILFFVFAFIFIALFVRKFPYMISSVAVCCAVIAALGFVGVDRLIADVNYDLYEKGVTEQVDADVLYDCGAPGFGYLVELTKANPDDVNVHNLVYWYYTDNLYGLLEDDGGVKNALLAPDFETLKALRVAGQNKEYLDSFEYIIEEDDDLTWF